MAVDAGEAFCRLVELMERLRGPEGCPWDRAQDYESVKGLLLEEAYEVVDAVNSGDFNELKEELGDLLFQVVFYSRLAEEDGKFAIGDMVEGVYEKLVRRHPHVFGEKRARTPEEALESWSAVKRAEGKDKPKRESLMDGIAAALPANFEAYEVGLRASQVGFDWEKPEDLLDKLEEELDELRAEMADNGESRNRQKMVEELGDLLFTAANLARRIHSDPESCLRGANQKFKRRFQELEQEAARRGKKPAECGPQELNEIWDSLKARELR